MDLEMKKIHWGTWFKSGKYFDSGECLIGEMRATELRETILWSNN